MKYKVVDSKCQASQEGTNDCNQQIGKDWLSVEDSSHHCKWRDDHLSLVLITLWYQANMVAPSFVSAPCPQPSSAPGMRRSMPCQQSVQFHHSNSLMLPCLFHYSIHWGCRSVSSISNFEGLIPYFHWCYYFYASYQYQALNIKSH